MANTTAGLTASWSDIWLLDGVRTPFADYNGALAAVSPTDLGIKAAREVFAHAGVAPQDVGAVITGSMAQASFDTYCLPRHIGLYSGRADRDPGAHGATGLRHRHRSADAGG